MTKVEPLSAVVVDDEPLARDLIRGLLGKDDEVEIKGEATGRDAASLILRERPHILFLDIQMPEVDGFRVLEQVGASLVPSVVFVTAYDRFALQAFDVHALDYLLKPVDERRFGVALGHAKRRAREHQRGQMDARIAKLLDERATSRSRFLVPERGKMVVVDAQEIDWIEAADYYVSLHVSREGTRGSHLLRDTMDDIEQKLDPEKFVRVHRGAIVNLDRVREIQPLFRGDALIVLDDGTRVRLSRGRRKVLEGRFAVPRARR